MAKKDLNLNIIQDTDFDPIDFMLNQNNKDSNTGDEDDEDVTDDDDDEEDDDDQDDDGNDQNNDDDQDDDDDQASAKNKGKNKKQSGPKKLDFSKVDIPDEVLEGSFRRTSTVLDDEDDDQPKKKKTPNKQKPATAGAASANANTDDDDDDGEDVAGTEDAETNAFSAHYKLMVKSGKWKETENFDGTKEAYNRAEQENYERMGEEALDEYLDEAFARNPHGKQMGMRFIKHLAAGGSVTDFVALNAPRELDFDALDSDKDEEATAAANGILRQYYTDLGWKKPQIDKKMANLEKTGSTVEEAQLVAPAYKEQIEANATAYEENQKKRTAQQKKSQQQFNEKILGMINTGHAFGGIKIGKDKKDKDEYKSYFFTPDPETQRTQLQTDLNAALQDPEFLLYIAAAYRNKLHQKPELAANTKKAKREATDDVESTLSSALLNKKIGQHSAKTGFEGGGKSSKKAGGADSRFEFDLENAVPIYQ